MAHLLNKEGQPIAVGDGLGVPIENWQVGDVIVQHHAMEVPTGTAPGTYWVQTGAYTLLAESQRLAVLSDEQPVGDRVVLMRVEVLSQ
jgi:hypothetical protein